MSRNVRSFWLDIYVDGRKSRIGTGPQDIDGGFIVEVKYRSCGAVCSESFKLIGVSDGTALQLQLVTPHSKGPSMVWQLGPR